MRYTEFALYPTDMMSVSGASTRMKSSESSVADIYERWTEPFLVSAPETSRQTLTIPTLLFLPSSPITQSMDWQRSVLEHLMNDFYIRKAPTTSLTLGNYLTPFPTVVEKFLPKIDGALGFLSTRVGSSVEGIFFNFRGTPRPPGFVVDIRIIIPEYNRELEYKVYNMLGAMIREYPDLLFDAHILASKKREPEDFLPASYVQYLPWSG